MFILNIGQWKFSKLHTFKIFNLNPNDPVIFAKKKIVEIMEMNNELDELELIYCGSVMENKEKLCFYVKGENENLIFMVKREVIEVGKPETLSLTDLQKVFENYKEIYSRPGFKQTILNYVNKEIITKVAMNVSELSEDSVARSIIKDVNLFKSILKPSVMKNQLSIHPALMLTVDYLIRDIPTNINGQFRTLFNLTDEDFSESDDIEMDYLEPTTSLADDFPELSSSFQNDVRGPSNYPSNIFEDVLMNLNLENHRRRNSQQYQDTTPGLSTQLRQMHEMGLLDDVVNFRALQIAGDNVQEAVELILNGIIE